MPQYGEPQTFTLDYRQMNQLFELLEKELPKEPTDNHPLECLRALRNQLYRHLD